MRNIDATINKFNKKSSLLKRISLLIFITLFIFILVNTAFKYRYKILNVILSIKYFAINGRIFHSISSEQAVINIFNKKLKVNINANNISPSDSKTILNGIKVSLTGNRNQYLITLFADSGILFANKDIEISGNINILDMDSNRMKCSKIYGNIKSGKITGDKPFLTGTRSGYDYKISSDKMVYFDNDLLSLERNINIFADNPVEKVKSSAKCDNLLINYVKKIITLSSNINLIYNNYNIKTDKMVITLDNTNDSINTIDANGNVFLYDDKVKIYSENAHYIASENKIIFLNNVKILENGVTVSAHKVVYDMITKKSEIVAKSNIRSLKTLSDHNIEIFLD